MVDPLRDAALTCLCSAVACLAVGRVVIGHLARLQGRAPTRYEDCPPLLAYHEGKRAIPSMGGVFVLGTGTLVAALAGGLSSRDGWLVLGAVLGLAALGLYDDYAKLRSPNAIGMRSMPKLFIALAIGAALGFLAASSGHRLNVLDIPWGGLTLDLGWAWVPFAMLVMAGSAHAVNLTDGMDGLASGCAAIALAVFGVWMLQRDPAHHALAAWCASLAGACLGFLWFNGFPATVFLGDVGALGLGAALGSISLLTHSALWLMVVGGVFVAEALSVMLQVASYKWRGKRRIFRVAPLHHHFQTGGLSEPKVIMRFWIAGLMLALLGLTRPVMP